jgi:hypothetical protein
MRKSRAEIRIPNSADSLANLKSSFGFHIPTGAPFRVWIEIRTFRSFRMPGFSFQSLV